MGLSIASSDIFNAWHTFALSLYAIGTLLSLFVVGPDLAKGRKEKTTSAERSG